jgi:nitroimidazol reductase NimA-like FMN-containing flavoprotein (pyridoxamine 5'-phosphate oxidase superfamily)
MEFKEMRRIEREVTPEEIESIIVSGTYGVWSTLNENGYPYGVPMNYVYLNQSIYLHCAMEGQKLDNIRRHDKVTFCITGKEKILPDKFSTEYESVIAFGTASEVQGDEKKAALVEFLRKYSPGFMEQGQAYIERAIDKTMVVKITIQQLTGKARRAMNPPAK